MGTEENFGHSGSFCLLDLFDDFPKIRFYFPKSLCDQTVMVCEYSSSEIRVII